MIGARWWNDFFGLRSEEVVVRDAHVRIANTTYRIDRGDVLLDERIVRASTRRRAGEAVRRSLSQEW